MGFQQEIMRIIVLLTNKFWLLAPVGVISHQKYREKARQARKFQPPPPWMQTKIFA